MDKKDASELYTIWDEARSHIESGNYDKAIEIYRYILIRYSDDNVAVEYANAYLGDIFLTLRQLDLAENHTKKAIGYKPEKPDYHYILGFIYSVKQQWDKAIQEFQIAVDKEPDNGEYLRGLAWAIYSSGDTTEGLASLEKASRLAPGNAKILTDLAVAYLSSVNIDKAREYAERAICLDPTNALAQDALENILIFNKRLRQRGKEAGKATTRSSDYAHTHYTHRFKVSLRDKPDIWRIIEIKENQMLSSLHKAIFKAFDRFDEHQYSFFLSSKHYDRESEYISPGPDTGGMSKLASRIRIDSLALYSAKKFLYLFDYGDEWWHEVELISVTKKITRGSYPRVAKKQGKSPPQYPRSI